MTALHDLPLVDTPAGSDAPLDEDAFSAVLAQAWPRLLRFAQRRLRDHGEAEELVQETLLRAFQHRESLATAEDLLAWTHVVLGRLVIDRVRVRDRSVCVAQVPEGSRLGRDTADVVTAREEARVALDALAALPGTQASVLWAREVEGLGYDAIGERHGMTEPAVRSVLMRARRSLRREFAQRGGVAPVAGISGLAVLAGWLAPLRSAARLRQAALTTAAVGTAALAGLVLLTPRVDAAPPTRPAVVEAPVLAPAVDVAATAAAPVPARPGPASVPAVVAPTGAAGARPAGTASAPADETPAAATPLGPSLCAGRGGLNCASPEGEDRVVVALPTVAVGVGVHGVGLTLAGASCPTLPDGRPLVGQERCDPREPAGAASPAASPGASPSASAPLSNTPIPHLPAPAAAGDLP